MSFDHWWFSSLLSTSDEERFEVAFVHAKNQAVLTPEANEGLAYWQAHPERFSLAWEESTSLKDRKTHGEGYNRFIWAFDLPAYSELSEQVLSFLSEETCFRFISISRCAPVALLWQCIGRQRAESLPGLMGNLFLKAHDVPNALAQTQRAFAGLGTEHLLQKGIDFAGHSNGEKEILSVITHLPEGLERAAALGRGFMAIARPQL